MSITIGKRFHLRVVSRSGSTELIECVAVALENDLIWCRCLRVLPTERRPAPGMTVSLTLQDAGTALVAQSVIRSTRLTRRGLALAIAQPVEWLPRTDRTSVRVPTEIPAHVLRQSDVARPGARPMPSTIYDISKTGARVRGRLVLHNDERLLLTFRLDGSDDEHAVVAQVRRAIRTQGTGSSGYEAGVHFVKMLDRTRAALDRYVENSTALLSDADDALEFDPEQELADLRLRTEPEPPTRRQKPAGLEWVDDDLMQSFLDVA